MLTLEAKEVLVVGGTSGMGLATAQAAAKRGARVTVASRSPDKVRAAERLIGSGAVGRALDATDDDEVARFFADGKVWDHVAVTAAAVKAGPVRELPLDDAYAAMNSKFWGAYRVARAAKIAPGGSLTFVSGLWARRPVAGMAVVSAVNAALEGLTRGLALDFAPLRVNCVSPGIIDTPTWQGLGEAGRRAMFERIAASLPVRHVGQPEDIAEQILLFMTNPYASGAVAFIDGGGMIA